MSVKLKISKGRKKSLVKLPVAFLDRYLPDVNGDYLRIYLYCLKLCVENIELSDLQIAKNLGVLKNDVKNAWKYWEREGVLSIAADGTIELENPEELEFIQFKTKLEDEGAAPSHERVFAVIKDDKKLKKAVQVIESIYCELLTQNDVLMIYEAVVAKKIPLEVFTITLSHCLENNKKNMKYIVKVVSENYKNGLTTVEDVEEHFRILGESRQYTGLVKKAVNIGGRDLIDMEKTFVDKWKTADKSLEEVKAAYEKTVMNTGKLSFPYMDKIIMSENGNKPAAKSSIKPGPLNNFNQDRPNFNQIMDDLIKRQYNTGSD
jgi:DnaD/phage-associated family protein